MSEEREEYGDYSVDDEDQLQSEDVIADDDDPDDPLDQGYSPAERYSTDYGNTPWEEEHRETIDQRMRQEVPEEEPDTPRDEEIDDGEVGAIRAGRLVDPDEGLGEDDEKDLVGRDVGIDGAGASAEEAAVHVVPDEWDED